MKFNLLIYMGLKDRITRCLVQVMIRFTNFW